MKIIRGNIAFPDADEFMVRELSAEGTYQRSHLDAGLQHVNDFRCAIDGGAHVGMWTRLLSQRFRRVIAIEPSRDTYEALLWNIDHWRLTGVEAHNVALWRDHGYVEMQLDPQQAARKNTGGRYVKGALHTTDAIPRIPIDSLDVTGLGFLKLDIEGAELAALEGATQTLKVWKPVVLFEEKGLGVKHFAQRKNAVQTFLTKIGYQRVQVVGCDEIWKPR